MDRRGEPDQQEFTKSREPYPVQALQRMRQRASADEDDEPGGEAFRLVMENGQPMPSASASISHAPSLWRRSGSAGWFSGVEFSVITRIGRPNRRPRSSGASPASRQAAPEAPFCGGATTWTLVMLYYNVPPMPHDHSHDHAHHHHGHAHSHGPATPHPAQPAPWSILRMTVTARLAAALAVSAGLWAVVLVAMR
jgi:hypothetical protein